MKFYRDLYLGPSVEKKQRRIVWKLKKNGSVPGIYLLVLPANPRNLLDIVPSWCSFHYEELHVVGLAHGKQEAIELTAQLVDEVYQATGGVEIRAYLQSRQESVK